mgnify:FL=1
MILTSDLWSETVTLTFDLGQDVPRRINWVVSEDLIIKGVKLVLNHIVLYYDLITNPDWFSLRLGDALTTNPHTGLIVIRSDRA